jgi:hypothetical protein
MLPPPVAVFCNPSDKSDGNWFSVIRQINLTAIDTNKSA